MRYILAFLIALPVYLAAQSPIQQIRQLKDGAMFVRLKTSENTILGLKEVGRFEEARQVEEKQAEKNRKIIAAFSEHYDFSQVYYFYTTYSKDIKNRHFKGKLLDEDLQPVGELPPADIDFFIAEFWFIERSDEGYYQDQILKDDTSGYRTKQTIYTGDTELGPDALIIRGPDFVQLDHPFPFSVRTYEGFPILRRSTAKVVGRLNKELHAFYQKTKK